MNLYKCNHSGCEQPGLYRFTWPGRNEAHICELHVDKLRGVAEAMGLNLQIISILDEAHLMRPETPTPTREASFEEALERLRMDIGNMEDNDFTEVRSAHARELAAARAETHIKALLLGLEEAWDLFELSCDGNREFEDLLGDRRKQLEQRAAATEKTR